jgi:hypothetical protein
MMSKSDRSDFDGAPPAAVSILEFKVPMRFSAAKR